MHSDDTLAKPSRVQSRLLKVFVLQLALISAITVSGVFAASLVAERILVNQALVGEASYFWSQRAEDPSYPLPDTLNLQSWFASGAGKPEIPDALVNLEVGQHRVMVDGDGDDRIVYVSERDGDKLYLLFQDETVSNLAFYFGVVPLTIVLLVMYSTAFLAYWLSKRAVSPIAQFADYIERFDLNARDASELDLAQLPGPEDSETRVLARALEHFIERSKVSLERERNFTRYASHELRTPIAVIQGSVATLELTEHSGSAARALARIKRSSGHMAQLINSLLLLARDQHADDAVESVDVVQLVQQLIDELQTLQPRENVKFVLELVAGEIRDDTVSDDVANALVVQAPVAVLSIVLGNILRNAWKYTKVGQITITIHEMKVSIKDTGNGLSAEQQKRIFEPFYRIEQGVDYAQPKDSKASDNSRTAGQTSPELATRGSATRGTSAGSISGPQIEGLGLGLAIVAHFCNIYSWQLSVKSKLGEGSCFELDFTQGRPH